MLFRVIATLLLSCVSKMQGKQSAFLYWEIADMLEKKILHQLPGKGRSVHYDLEWPTET